MLNKITQVNRLSFFIAYFFLLSPKDLEQRSGRIVRQGNENDKVNIFRYVTENTFDAYLWVRHEVA